MAQGRSTAGSTASENVLATLEVDIDPAMNFTTGALALTDRRLLGWVADRWSEWRLADGLLLRHGDHGGIGTLELLDGDGRLALWRFTLAQAGARCWPSSPVSSACSPGQPAAAEESPADEDEADEDTRPPSTWVLLRWAASHAPTASSSRSASG
jgi:ATP-binding cassette subfamily B protein